MEEKEELCYLSENVHSLPLMDSLFGFQISETFFSLFQFGNTQKTFDMPLVEKRIYLRNKKSLLSCFKWKEDLSTIFSNDVLDIF
jgi:hypothetical protein